MCASKALLNTHGLYVKDHSIEGTSTPTTRQAKPHGRAYVRKMRFEALRVLLYGASVACPHVIILSDTPAYILLSFFFGKRFLNFISHAGSRV
jgi:hypothetical protein